MLQNLCLVLGLIQVVWLLMGGGETMVLDSLLQFSDIILPTVYVSFFLGTLGVLAFARHHVARGVWLAGFFTTLLAVTAVGTPLLPVVDMHKFSNPPGKKLTYYDVRVVDRSGNEIALDERAVPPMTGSHMSGVGERIVNSYTDAERIEMGEFYISNAREYRHEVQSGETSVAEHIDPPRYTADQKWTASELDQYDRFESIRVYERTVTFSDDNSNVESINEHLRVTIDVTNDTVTEHENT